MADPTERRKERRYIVVGMDLFVGGEPCPIIDISRTAVRVLQSPATLGHDRPIDLVLRVQGRTRRSCREYKVSGWYIRGSSIDAVFGYEPPTRRWESTLRAHDTFHQTRLVEI